MKQSADKERIRFRKNALYAVMVLCAAGSVRLLYLYEIKDIPFFSSPVIDAETYFRHAMAIASGLLLGREAFWQAPLYPYLLAIPVKLIGPDHFFLHLLHSLLGAFNCVLIFWLGTKVAGRGPALLAALLACFYGPFIFFEGEYLRPVLIVFLNLLLLMAFVRARKSPGLLSALGIGLLCGLAALARPNVVLFVPFAMGWYAWTLRPYLSRKALFSRILLIAAGACMSMAPATLHNAVVSREFIPVSSNGGANFYIGNNPDWRETLSIRPTLEWADLMAEPYRHGFTSPGQRSDYFFRKAMQDIMAEPLSWARTMTVKTGQLLHGHEYARNVDLYAYRGYSFVLRVLLWKHLIAFPYGALVPFALVGFLLFVASREPGKVLIALYAIACSISVIIFFIAARYRIPLIPAFILFASYSPFWLARKFKDRDYKKIIAALAVILAAFAGCNFGIHKPGAIPPSEIHLLLGNALRQKGDLQLALKQYKQAMLLDPHMPDPFFQAGIVLSRTGQLDKAREMFQKTMRMTQEGSMAHAWSHEYLGHMAKKQGRMKKAVSHYESSLEAFAYQFGARLHLALALQELGDVDRAEQELLTLKDQYPRYPEPWRALARLYTLEGRPEKARPYLQRARELSAASNFKPQRHKGH